MVGKVLSPDLGREALAEILKIEGVSTSAIEGQVLNPASVAASVARHLRMPLDQQSPQSRDADGLVGVLCDATERFGEQLSVERLCAWQQALFPESMSGLDRVVTGTLRPDEVVVQSGPAGRELVDFEAIPRVRLEAELDAFLSWFNGSQGRVDGMIRAGIAHLWLVTIHPFEDGNGRVTRAVTDMALAQDEGRPDFLYRMSARINEVKGDYYNALRLAQSFDGGMDATPWLQWFLTQIPEACSGSEKVIRKVLGKAVFWTKHREADLNERQRKVLNRLLDAGPGGFEGGLNARKYENLAHTSKPSATRDLAELVQLGCLVHLGAGGRSTAYDIPWEELFPQ
jgi:Fic family protein